MDKITILMPIYNGIEFIEESVNSIKKQTYTNWELIIGINGHQENSEVYKIANKYKNDKIKIYDIFHIKGKSNALNTMIKYSTADWISLLDVDDIWISTKLESQQKYMINYDVIGTRCKYFGDSNIEPKIPIGDLCNFNFLEYNPIINSSSLIKKELCKWNNNEDVVEDYDLWLKLKKENRKFYNVDSIQVLHRIHKNSYFNSNGNDLKVLTLKKKYSTF